MSSRLARSRAAAPSASSLCAGSVAVGLRVAPSAAEASPSEIPNCSMSATRSAGLRDFSISNCAGVGT